MSEKSLETVKFWVSGFWYLDSGTLDPGTDSSTIRNVVNNSIKHGGQARNIIIDARGIGLSEAEALRGLESASGISRGKVENITLIGDGYFLNKAVE